MKCNDSPVVIKILNALGAGFDCASKGEIGKVLRLGVDSKSIIYANPAKSVAHLKFADENNVSLMTVDNEFELYKIKKHYSDAR